MNIDPVELSINSFDGSTNLIMHFSSCDFMFFGYNLD